jgi:hypothetical protein
MHVFNISFQILPSMVSTWENWMKSSFIPMIVATECFVDYKFYEIAVDNDQAPTYTLQLYAITPEMQVSFEETLFTPILAFLVNTWGEQCFYFITKMKIVH